MCSKDKNSSAPSKLPFYFGGFLLITLALVVAYLNSWQVQGIQAIALILLFALGTNLLVLPCLIKCLMPKADGGSEVCLSKKQLGADDNAPQKQSERFGKTPASSDSKIDTKASSAEALDQRVGDLETSVSQRALEISSVEQQLNTLKHSLKQTDKFLETLKKTFADQLPNEDAAEDADEAESGEVLAEKVLARVDVKLVSLSNKPFIRGSGGGLSWQKGVQLEFVKMGKWSWTAPADMDEMIEYQIYLNDKDPDKTGKHFIEHPQQVEIEPKF